MLVVEAPKYIYEVYRVYPSDEDLDVCLTKMMDEGYELVGPPIPDGTDRDTSYVFTTRKRVEKEEYERFIKKDG